MLRTPPHPVTAESTADRTERLLAAIRVALVAALTALVLAIAARAYVVRFEAIRAFVIEPPPSRRSWRGRRRCWSTASPPPHPS